MWNIYVPIVFKAFLLNFRKKKRKKEKKNGLNPF